MGNALLLLPDHALGSWFDGEQNRHILDVVVCPLSLEEAIRLGTRYGQKAIYDLEAGREISLAVSMEINATRFGGEEN
jgi:hypothetical protein